MKKYRFPLETLLRHRQELEEKERNSLLQLRAGLRREEDFRDRLEAVKESARQEMATGVAAGAVLDPVDLQLSTRYLQRLGVESDRSEKRIESLSRDVQTQTSAVVDATRKTKVLDTLKGKSFKEYRRNADSLEQKSVDDLVATRFVGKKP